MIKLVEKLTISIIKLSDYSIMYSHKYYHIISMRFIIKVKLIVMILRFLIRLQIFKLQLSVI